MGLSLAARLVGALLLALAGFVLGQRLKQGEWDAAALEQRNATDRKLARQAEQSMAASTAHEQQRAAIAAQLRRSRDALSIALRAPISCPTDSEPGSRAVALGDVLLPAAALDGVRSAGAPRRDPGSATGESRAGL